MSLAGIVPSHWPDYDLLVSVHAGPSAFLVKKCTQAEFFEKYLEIYSDRLCIITNIVILDEDSVEILEDHYHELGYQQFIFEGD